MYKKKNKKRKSNKFKFNHVIQLKTISLMDSPKAQTQNKKPKNKPKPNKTFSEELKSKKTQKF